MAGQLWKTQVLVRRILREMYDSDASGYAFPGMDDQGSTVSWYGMSAMGFYTVDRSSPQLHPRQPDLSPRVDAHGHWRYLRNTRKKQLRY